jgi:hypothetical protein
VKPARNLGPRPKPAIVWWRLDPLGVSKQVGRLAPIFATRLNPWARTAKRYTSRVKVSGGCRDPHHIREFVTQLAFDLLNDYGGSNCIIASMRGQASRTGLRGLRGLLPGTVSSQDAYSPMLAPVQSDYVVARRQ